MKKLTLLILVITFLGLIANFPIPTLAQDRTPGPEGTTDPYAVTFYEEKDYANLIGTWRLASGMRMLKLPTFGRVPKSILVGSSVGVLLFYDYHFRSEFHVVIKYDWNPVTQERVNEQHSLVSYRRFENSSPLMFPDPRYIPKRSSIIIHRKDRNDWLGAELTIGKSIDIALPVASYQFYPLPEKASQKVIIYPKIPSGERPYFLGLVPGGTLGYNLDDIEVTVDSTYGGSQKFPDPKNKTERYELQKYGIVQPSALKIEYKGLYEESAYIYSARVVAPTAPNVAKTGTQIPQGYPAGPGKAEVPAAKAAQIAVFNVSGQWKNGFGWIYNITQQQDVFQWTVVNSSEKGNGTIKGYDLSVSWQGPLGNGSAQGKIIEVDANGTATKILWSNGVQFFR